jgi:lysophospholipase L1-like esterase
MARLLWQQPTPQPQVTDDASDLPLITSIATFSQPNVRARMTNNVPYSTNALGLRGPEVSLKVPADTFRIVVVGDSVTAGWGVHDNEPYPALLEAALNAQPTGRRYEVLNLGIPGFNLTEVLSRLEKVGLPLDPDLVVYGLTVNDIESSPVYRRIPPDTWHVLAKQARYDRFRDSRSHLLRLLWPRWIALDELIRPDPEGYVAELRDNYFHNPDAWGHVTAGLDRLAALQESRHMCVVVFIHTHLYYLNRFHPLQSIYDQIAKAAEARGLVAIQSLPAHFGLDDRALHVGPLDPHPNAAAHQCLARALREGLRKLPASCWRGGPVPPV